MDSQIEQQAPVATELDRATAVSALGNGRYLGEVTGEWSAPTGPNGGYLAAIAARALQAHVAPSGERRLRSLTCHYLRPARVGELDLEVEVLRTGRRFSTGRLTATQDGKQAFTALAAFSVADLPSAATWSPAMPAVEPAPTRDAERVDLGEYSPSRGAWLAPVEQAPPIVRRVKIAPQFGDRPFAGRELAHGEAPVTGGWIELPQPRPIDAVYIALLADVWWPPAFEPLSSPAIAPTIDLTIHVRAEIPPAGLPGQPVLGRYTTSAASGGLIDEDGSLFLADGTLLAQSRQLALLAPLG